MPPLDLFGPDGKYTVEAEAVFAGRALAADEKEKLVSLEFADFIKELKKKKVKIAAAR